MIVALDNSFLSLIFYENARPGSNPATGKPVEHCQLRVDAMIEYHSSKNDIVLIPTPCLTELLVIVPDFAKIINEISRSVAFEIAAFDVRASIDLAEERRKAKLAGDKRSGVGMSVSWSEVNFDRQIAAIAKSRGAEIFYTDDKTQTTFANMIGLKVKHTWDLDLPPEFAQVEMSYKDHGDKET